MNPRFDGSCLTQYSNSIKQIKFYETVSTDKKVMPHKCQGGSIATPLSGCIQVDSNGNSSLLSLLKENPLASKRFTPQSPVMRKPYARHDVTFEKYFMKYLQTDIFSTCQQTYPLLDVISLMQFALYITKKVNISCCKGF